MGLFRLVINAGWSNFFTFAGHFSNLFELTGFKWLEIVENQCSLKKKSSLGIDLRFSYFRLKNHDVLWTQKSLRLESVSTLDSVP